MIRQTAVGANVRGIGWQSTHCINNTNHKRKKGYYLNAKLNKSIQVKLLKWLVKKKWLFMRFETKKNNQYKLGVCISQLGPLFVDLEWIFVT